MNQTKEAEYAVYDFASDTAHEQEKQNLKYDVLGAL